MSDLSVNGGGVRAARVRARLAPVVGALSDGVSSGGPVAATVVRRTDRLITVRVDGTFNQPEARVAAWAAAGSKERRPHGPAPAATRLLPPVVDGHRRA
jgi:hypothetical protein